MIQKTDLTKIMHMHNHTMIVHLYAHKHNLFVCLFLWFNLFCNNLFFNLILELKFKPK